MTDDKKVPIVVNGTPEQWDKGEQIGFDAVAKFAYSDFSPTDGRTYTVKYTRGHGDKPEGQLFPGTSVKIKEGINFRVSRTGQS